MDRQTWGQLVHKVDQSVDILEDGAIVRTTAGGTELMFFATELNHPTGWHLPFSEPISLCHRDGAAVGRAYHDAEMNETVLVVELIAAVQLLTADYESGIVDLDYVAYENAVDLAAAGKEADQTWLQREWDRCMQHLQAKNATE